MKKSIYEKESRNAWAKEYEAPEGKIWMCGACGKRSPNRANGPGMWDESCFINAVLVDKE